MTEPRHTLSVSQAAEALGVSERTVWRYLKAGRLAGETVGPPGAQRTLIHDAAVDALRLGRDGGAEAAELRRRLEAALADLARAQAERDGLRARVAELQRALPRPAPARPGRRALEGALAAASRLRAPGPLARRLAP